MTELKTLKDIGNEASEREGKIQCCRDCQIDFFWNKLKAEAVKWVKDRQARKENKQYLDIQLAIFDEQIGWIKHFFNLTEEEIKGEEKWKQ